MRHPDRAYLFFSLALILTAVLVITGKAELTHFLGVFGFAASCLGFYQAQPPSPKAGPPSASGPAAGLLLPFLVLSVLACEGGEVRLHLVTPRAQAAPISASSLQLYRHVAPPSCASGLTCLSATAAGTLVQTSGSTTATLATLPLTPAELPQTITAGSCTTCSLTWNGAGQLTVATTGSGSGGGAYFSPVKLYASGIDPLGDYSVGCKYVVVTDSITVSGVRFRRYGTATTITAKLWRGGSALASASVAVTPPGVVEVSFTSAVTLSLGDIFWTTIHDEELVSPRYARGAALSWEPGDWSGAGFFTAHASGVYLLHPGQYGSGDQRIRSAAPVADRLSAGLY